MILALVSTQPVKSYPDQDHTAHLAVHQQWLSTITDADTRKRVEPAAIVDPRARVVAAEKLLDRGYGRPSQQVDHSGDLALRHNFAVDGRQAQAIAREFLIGVVPTQDDGEEQESEDDDDDESSEQ